VLPSRAMITAFLLIVCEPQRIHEVGQALADMEGVAEVYTTTGSTDFIAVVRVSDLDALASLVTEHIATQPGIRSTDTHLAMRSFGRNEIQAAFDIGLD
jgi:DNA-binding Lrp family transcriptional regulator